MKSIICLLKQWHATYYKVTGNSYLRWLTLIEICKLRVILLTLFLITHYFRCNHNIPDLFCFKFIFDHLKKMLQDILKKVKKQVM